MYVIAQRVAFEERRDLAHGSFGGGYTAVGTPFAHPIRMLKIVNRTDVVIDVSFDGSTTHDVITANGAFIYDFTSNTTNVPSAIWAMNQGTQVYVQGTPTTGSVYVVAIYASKNGE